MMESTKKRENLLGRVGVAGGIFIFAIIPLILGRGSQALVNEMMILAVAACGLNIMLGYAGMVSFGPAGIYMVGAYAPALLLYYTGIPFGITFIAGPVAAALVSIVVGWFCVRLTHVYFSLLTLAFSAILHTIVFEWYAFTHGDDGIVELPIPEFLMPITNYYYFTLIIACIALGLMWMIVKSPFGKTLQALRENPERTEFIGIHVRRYQLATFVIAGFFLGLAGALYCGLNRAVFPDLGDVMKSTEMLVVCLMGGIYYFFGPVAGAVVYIYLDKTISSYTQYWPLVLGIVIVLLLLFLRGGIIGFFDEKIRNLKQKRT